MNKIIAVYTALLCITVGPPSAAATHSARNVRKPTAGAGVFTAYPCPIVACAWRICLTFVPLLARRCASLRRCYQVYTQRNPGVDVSEADQVSYNAWFAGIVSLVVPAMDGLWAA